MLEHKVAFFRGQVVTPLETVNSSKTELSLGYLVKMKLKKLSETTYVW